MGDALLLAKFFFQQGLVLGLTQGGFRLGEARATLLVLEFERCEELARLVRVLEFDVLAKASFGAVGATADTANMKSVYFMGGPSVSLPPAH